MLRLGTGHVRDGMSLLAQRQGETDFIDAAALLVGLACRSLDDFLDLPDNDLGEALATLRQANPSLPADCVTLIQPLVRPTRIRDCGMIKTHLKPAFEEMILRMAGLDSQESRAAQAFLKERLSGLSGKGVLSWGERDTSTLSGPRSVIPNPGGELDFELELAAIIRRSGAGRPEIFGYTLYNDWTLRDVQIDNFIRTRNLHGSAKNFPGSNSFGPMVVIAEDFGNPASEMLRVEVNGDLIAEGTLEDAAWSFEEALIELFRDAPIKGHEIVASGTILGGSMFERGRRLPDGAVVRLISPSIGVLENSTEVRS